MAADILFLGASSPPCCLLWAEFSVQTLPQSSGMHSSFKDYNDNVLSPGFGGRFSIASTWGITCTRTLNESEVKSCAAVPVSSAEAVWGPSPWQQSQEGAWCEGRWFLCSAPEGRVWRYFCHCPVLVFAGMLVLALILVVALFWCCFPTFATYVVFFENLSAGTSTAPDVLLLPFRDNICCPCFRAALDFLLL